jgi:hypothetical protein
MDRLIHNWPVTVAFATGITSLVGSINFFSEITGSCYYNERKLSTKKYCYTFATLFLGSALIFSSLKSL